MSETKKWALVVDEMDLYAISRGAHWTFGESVVQGRLKEMIDRAKDCPTDVITSDASKAAAGVQAFERWVTGRYSPRRTAFAFFGYDDLKEAWNASVAAAGPAPAVPHPETCEHDLGWCHTHNQHISKCVRSTSPQHDAPDLDEIKVKLRYDTAVAFAAGFRKALGEYNIDTGSYTVDGDFDSANVVPYAKAYAIEHDPARYFAAASQPVHHDAQKLKWSLESGWHHADPVVAVHHDALTDKMIAEAGRKRESGAMMQSAFQHGAEWARDHRAVHHDADALAERCAALSDDVLNGVCSFKQLQKGCCATQLIDVLNRAHNALRSKADATDLDWENMSQVEIALRVGQGHVPPACYATSVKADSSDALALCDEWETCGEGARKRYEGRKPGRKPVANIDDADADDVTAIIIATIIPEFRAALRSLGAKERVTIPHVHDWEPDWGNAPGYHCACGATFKNGITSEPVLLAKERELVAKWRDDAEESNRKFGRSACCIARHADNLNEHADQLAALLDAHGAG